MRSETCRRRALALGLYVLIELLLPGGTLLAAALYLLRRARPSRNSDKQLQLFS